MFLSQPGMETLASYHCAPMTVSMESAMRSRDCSEKLMPSVPIEMPSLTPMVLKRMPTRPAAATPSLTFSASVSRCMLHGLPSYQTLAMPTCGLCHILFGEAGGVEHGLGGALGGGCVIREL